MFRNQNPYAPDTVLDTQVGPVEKTVSVLALLMESNGRTDNKLVKQ